MNVSEALKAIPNVKGHSTIIGTVLAGDYSHLAAQDGTNATIEDAKARLAEHKELQKNCKSDYAYWGHLGDVVYWEAIINVLEAAKITGVDNLPDVEAPNAHGIVMDVYGRVANYGRRVLELANQEAPR